MEYKLALNDHKGGWEETSVEDLQKRLLSEVQELNDAIKTGNKYHITLECADIANYAMMIAWNLTGGKL